MTKDQRLKAMGRVIDACHKFKDKKPLAEAVRQIVADLQAEEAAHREKSRGQEAINLMLKKGETK